MRLIDADALMKKIREVDFVADVDLMKITHDSMLTGFFHGSVQGIVDRLPTAYDPDKIVEQLEEKAFEMWDEDNPYTNPKVIKLDRAIEILKGECNGQIDNDTDKAIEQLEEKFLTEKDFRAKGCWLDAIEIVKSGGAENDS